MKKLSLKDIKSGLLMGKPEEITVQILVSGEQCEFTTFITPFSYATAVAQLKAFGESREALAGILASVICDKNGELEFTEEDIRTKFNQALVDAIWLKIVDVNKLGKTQDSAQTTNSLSKSESQQGVVTQKSKVSRSRKLKNTPHTTKSLEASTSEGV